MTARLVFRPDAEADLAAIAAYTSAHSTTRAVALIERLRKRCAILERHPLIGRLRPELGEGLRSLSERPYVVIYRARDNVVEVVSILHGARDLPAALAQRIAKEDS